MSDHTHNKDAPKETLIEAVDKQIQTGASTIECKEVPAEELISALQELLKAGYKVNVQAKLQVSD